MVKYHALLKMESVQDRSFTFILKTPPASVLLQKAAGIQKGSGTPNSKKVGKVTQAQVRVSALIAISPDHYSVLSWGPPGDCRLLSQAWQQVCHDLQHFDPLHRADIKKLLRRRLQRQRCLT